MKNTIQTLLRLFGYEVNPTYKNSLVFMHMIDVTHEGFIGKHMRHGTINQYSIKK